MYAHYIKRIIDFMLALLGLIILSPLYLVIIIAIKLDSKGPVLFEQERMAQHKQTFKIYKFRTMRTDTPHNMPTHMLAHADSFITPVGKFLRKTSLDELPQLLNILKGEMSIIGPRPCLMNQKDLIVARDEYGANDVKPGLTGLAQISGRDELPIPVKARYDGDYCQKITFVGDVKLFFETITSVLKHDGVKEGKTVSPRKES
ncbi:sugar transferase [Latilactobacillus curvatus]|uniref:sugar transferase n=1 Tax=Latilactobacillus curvatus TaxID=28038 RepID=UPI00240F40AB|nr:sugar transferase [Latilactobacillus curvatus]MDG2977058.1 sugar transferase [Latilactobacillus curvatus]